MEGNLGPCQSAGAGSLAPPEQLCEALPGQWALTLLPPQVSLFALLSQSQAPVTQA